VTRQTVTILVLAGLLVLALVGMRVGWVHRRRRTLDAVPTLPAVPTDAGALLAGPFEAVYVSTTREGDWLDRVAAHGLGVRSPARVSVHATGVHVARTGAPDVFVPAHALRAAALAPGIAGKVVGRDHLVVLTWEPAAQPGDEPDGARGLDTGLLPRHAADRDAIVAAALTLIPDVPAAVSGTEEKP